MKAKILIQATKAAKTKKRCAKRFDSLCGKYKLSAFYRKSFRLAILYWRMDIYESLCEKHRMSETDRNALARSLLIAFLICNSMLIGQN